MVNIFSFLHCCECKSRPSILFGRKKNKYKHTVYPLNTPLYSIHNTLVTPLVALENNKNITYNTDPFYLRSPLNDYSMPNTIISPLSLDQ